MTSSKRKPASAVQTDVLTIEEAAELHRCHPIAIKNNANVLHIPFRPSCCTHRAGFVSPSTEDFHLLARAA
jgi:hypothetical protein